MNFFYSKDNLVALHFKYDQARRRFVEWAQNEIAVVPDFHKRILFSDEAHFWLNGYVNKQNCRIWSEGNPQNTVTSRKLTVWCALWAGGIIRSSKTMKATTPVNWPPRSCDLTPLDYFLWVYADKPQTLDHLEDNIRHVIADIRPQMLEKVIENWTSRLDYIQSIRGSRMPEIIFKIVRSNHPGKNNRKFPDKDFLKILNSGQNIIIVGNLNAAHRTWSNTRSNAFGYALRKILNNKSNGALGSVANHPLEKAEVIADSLQKQFEPNTEAENDRFTARSQRKIKRFLDAPTRFDLEKTTPGEVQEYIKKA
ncbi:DUF4817 domain-containing protein [Trichonephila clavipes]|nr:DUF4817 domain-containing protein [Trichonephila clavipes]